MNAEYTQRLIEIGVQTLSNALLIGGGGFLLSRILERYKANQSLRVEIAKKRVEKLDEVWTAFTELENANRLLCDKLQKLSERGSTPQEKSENFVKDVVPLFDEFHPVEERTKNLLTKNRFWIGREAYNKFQKYNDLINEYSEALLEEKSDQAKIAEAKMEEARESAIDFLNTIG